MKNLQGKELQRGQNVVAKVSDGVYVAGVIHQLYDRNEQVRISGFAITIPAKAVALASDAYESLVKPE